MIPPQLKNERFILVNSEKRPIEKDWPNNTNYDYETKKHLTLYGVLCGNNNLMVIDCDQRLAQEKLMQIEQIRNTFIVQTAGKKLYHFYFYVSNTNNPKGFRMDYKGDRFLDLQGLGTQVIGPNSTLRDGKTYNIVNPTEIATIDYDILCDTVQNLVDNTTILVDGKKKDNPIGFETDEVCAAIKTRVLTDDLLPDESKGQMLTMCPLGHPSENQQCFSHNGTVWKCFHCNKHGNIFHLYMELHKCNFLTAKRELIKLAGLEDDFKVKILQLYADAKTKHVASERLAREIIKLNNIYTLRTDKDPEMWIYKDGIYVPHGRTHVKEFCRSILGPLYKTQFVNQVIEKIVADTYVSAPDFFINEDLNKVAVLNGVLDIRSKKLEPFSSDYKFFNKLPVHYDPLIKADKVVTFFKEVLVDEQDVNVVQELFGYLLYRDYSFEKAFMFLGSGRNGKGKLISLMEHFVGKVNCCNIPLQSLGSDRFAKSRLHNKLANLSADLNKTGLQDTGTFKSLTGRDLMTADRKFLEPIEFKNYAKMIFATNELPYTYDETDGFWDRWIVIDFVFKFVDDPEKKNHKKIDRDVIQKLTTDKELIGLLNWALEGLDRLFDKKRFSVSTSTENIKKKWKRESSSFSAFLMDDVDKDYDINSFLSNNQLNNAYSRYCLKHELTPESSKQRNFLLSKLGGYEKVKKIGGVSQRGWGGLKFKNDDVEEVELDENI
jgi:P4 family phage/plasmid primase-like protien